MENKSVREYLFNKLFFPKVVTIEKPGIIINKTSRLFGGVSQKRCIYYFEDIFINLQNETIKKLGKEEASELYYKIGKDLGTRYMLLADVKKPPKFLLSFVINSMFKVVASNGTSVARNITFNAKNNFLILEGANNIICRKTEDNSFFAGIFSGMFSFLIGENIEAEGHCNCPKHCKIVLSPKIKQKYIPNMNELRPLKNYNKLNFPENVPVMKKMDSFKDLIRFGKVWIDNKDNKHYFEGKVILPNTTDFAGLLVKHYKDIDQKNLLEKFIVNESQLIAKNIFKKLNKNQKIELTKNLFCAFGWGIPHYAHLKNIITLNLLYPPISEYGFLYEALVLNGFINTILNKKYFIKKIETKTSPVCIIISYIC